MCLRQAQASLTYERTHKKKYKVLLSEYAMHSYGFRLLQAYQSMCNIGQNPQVGASLNKRKSSIALVNTYMYIVFDKNIF